MTFASPASKDWVGTSSNGRCAALCWLVCRVFRASARSNTIELLHLKETFGTSLVVQLLCHGARVNVRGGHSSGSGVLFGRIEHLITVELVFLANRTRSKLLLIASNLAVEVSNDSLDGRSRAQGCSISEGFVVVGRNHHRLGQFFQTLTTRASVAQLAQSVSTLQSHSFGSDSSSSLAWMPDSNVGLLAEGVLMLFQEGEECE